MKSEPRSPSLASPKRPLTGRSPAATDYRNGKLAAYEGLARARPPNAWTSFANDSTSCAQGAVKVRGVGSMYECVSCPQLVGRPDRRIQR